METHFTSGKRKKQGLKPLITRVLLKWASNYIKSMSKALYPPGSEEVKSKNDRHRVFYK
ncbi:hypothetical protein [Aquimarina mytili]|uniref:Uncharacterized protein n=1 Tax=Aquimarina mytili TaxID=874423 RepID=A0A937D7A7_9FLAO|nr:hypothetical protein [Aquimarina mytili]MBL0682900.1 hypothetical protein [Aquimarina mytili]